MKSYFEKENIYNISWAVFLIFIGWFLTKILDNLVLPVESLSDFLFKKMQNYNNSSPFELLFPIIVCSAALISTSSLHKYFKNRESKEKLFFHTFITLLLYALFIFSCFYVSVPIRGKAVENNIEIISPYISEQEAKILKSRLLQISNTKDFNSLSKDIKEIAIKHNAKLQ